MKWILAISQLPDSDRDVLCYRDKQGYFVGNYNREVGIRSDNYWSDSESTFVHVIAWSDFDRFTPVSTSE